MRWGIVVCVLFFWAGAVRADSDKPIGIEFVGGSYWEGILQINNEGPNVMVFREQLSRGEVVAKKDIRYLVYSHYAIPYLDGVAQGQIGLFRETEYPHSGAIILGLTGFGVGVWQWMESRDSDKAYRVASAFGLSTKSYEDKGLRQKGIAVASILGGVIFTLYSLTPETTLKLPDGTIIGVTPTPDQVGMQVAYTWGNR